MNKYLLQLELLFVEKLWLWPAQSYLPTVSGKINIVNNFCKNIHFSEQKRYLFDQWSYDFVLKF